MLKIISGTLFYGHFAWNFLAVLAMGSREQAALDSTGNRHDREILGRTEIAEWRLI